MPKSAKKGRKVILPEQKCITSYLAVDSNILHTKMNLIQCKTEERKLHYRDGRLSPFFFFTMMDDFCPELLSNDKIVVNRDQR